MWVGDSANKKPDKLPLFFQRLREMGINTAMVYGQASPAPLLENQFPYYVENMVNRGLCLKWNSKVRDWDKLVTDWAKDGRPESALVRDYCLDDPGVARLGAGQMQRVARPNTRRTIRSPTTSATNSRRRSRPIRSTTISIPSPSRNFASGCKTQYRDLDALNRKWETHVRLLGRGEAVHHRPNQEPHGQRRRPCRAARPTGRRCSSCKFDPAEPASSRPAGTSSPWCDFRTYMDLSLARRAGRYPPGGARRSIRARPSASRARRCRMPSAATICGGSRRCWIGSSPTTSATPARSSAPSCRANRS